jgi:hypothetical protein
MAVADRHGLPVAVHIESATPHEVKLVVPTLVGMVIPEAPHSLVGDNAYGKIKKGQPFAATSVSNHDSENLAWTAQGSDGRDASLRFCPCPPLSRPALCV